MNGACRPGREFAGNKGMWEEGQAVAVLTRRALNSRGAQVWREEVTP